MEYVDVPIRVPKKLQDRIEELGEQCGLTGSQMASAIFALAGSEQVTANKTAAAPEEETHL